MHNTPKKNKTMIKDASPPGFIFVSTKGIRIPTVINRIDAVKVVPMYNFLDNSLVLTALDAIIPERIHVKNIQYAHEVMSQHSKTEFPLRFFESAHQK